MTAQPMRRQRTHARAGAEVVVHPQNRGKGETIKTGLRHWLDRGFQYVVILDGDGQHLPEEISRFISAASTNGARLLLGTRMNDVSRCPWSGAW